MQVKRDRKLSIADRLYLPSIFAGLALTFRHIFRKKDTIQYPEQKHAFGARYRGVPALVRDQDGRVFFAGEATSRQHPGTAHGAWLSGLREAERIAKIG